MRGLAAAVFCLALAGCTDPQPDIKPGGATYKVYFLGGQSNMDGYGFVSDLPAELSAKPQDAVIYHGKVRDDGEDGGGIGLWEELRPGHGAGFDTNGRRNALSDRFGPELTFGMAMAARPDAERVAIIKYAKGATALIEGVSEFGSWDPDFTGGNSRSQYHHALTAIRLALKARDVDGDGREDTLIPAGIVWMQGETDATDNPAAARDYAENLARTMALLRTGLGNSQLPVVIGRIKDSGTSPATRVMRYSPEVQAAQALFAASDRCAALVAVTDDFGFLPDGWHYLSRDYLTLGHAFAEAMAKLEGDCSQASKS